MASSTPTRMKIYSATNWTGALGRRFSNHNDFWKQTILNFLGKRTLNIHGFEGCFLKGQDSSNGFKDFNGYLVKPWIVLVGNTCTKMVILNKLVVVVVVFAPFGKKLENLMFSDIVGIRQSSSKCPGWRSRTVIHSWTPWSSLPLWPSWTLLESWFSWAPWDHFHCGEYGHPGPHGNHGH